MNFALLIRHTVHPDGNLGIEVRAENQGIPDAEVVLTVEAWVEKVKERLKQQRMGDLSFDADKR